MLESVVKAQRRWDDAGYQCREKSQSHEYNGSELVWEDEMQTLPAPDSGFEQEHVEPDERSHVAMEELASLMLTLGVEDKGEPSFTLSSGQSRHSLTPNPPSPEEPTALPQALPELQGRLLDRFLSQFNTFHQVLDQEETSNLRFQNLESGSLEFRFRNHALFSVAAYLSDENDGLELSQKHAALAEDISLKCIREHPSDLLVQGLALLSWRELQIGNDNMAYNYIGKRQPFLI